MHKDIFELLKDDGLPEPSQTGPMPVLSLWWVTKHYVMFFTFHPGHFGSHYDKDEGSYHCLGDECPACKAGVKLTEHVYVPVWDVLNRRIAVLKFEMSKGGPAAKIVPFLETYKDRLADIVVVIDCKGRGEFSLTAHEPLPETDRGALECKGFCEAMEAGAIDLRDCVKQLKPAQIAALRSVKKLAFPLVGRMLPPGTTPAAPVVDDGNTTKKPKE